VPDGRVDGVRREGSGVEADPVPASTLAAALRGLGSRRGRWSAAEVVVDAKAAGSVAGATARAAHHAAALALASSCSEGRAAIVRLDARLDGDPLLVRLLDDGIGVALRHAPPGPGVAFELRRLLGPVGGTVRLRDLLPHGALVELVLPRRPCSRASGQAPAREGADGTRTGDPRQRPSGGAPR
jgi:hypothetical protein